MTADEARAVRHSGCKCVPENRLLDAIRDVPTCDGEFQRNPAKVLQDCLRAVVVAYGDAPACECEARELLQDALALFPERDKEPTSIKAARAYLDRSKP